MKCLLKERKSARALDSKTEAWGIKVTSVEIRDVGIPPVLQDAAHAEFWQDLFTVTAIESVRSDNGIVTANSFAKE